MIYRMPLFRGPCLRTGFRVFGGILVLYIVYLDEFGHIGPFISRDHERHNDSPVFGLGGIILPADQVRGFGTWFFNRKRQLLNWEIQQSGEHPAEWEKKGSSLYTAKNVNQFKELRQFTFRFLNKIRNCGGYAFYVGVEKQRGNENYDSAKTYYRVLDEAIKRLNDFCVKDNNNAQFMMVMDEHNLREQFITRATQSMYKSGEARTCLIEPPFQVESHRFQTLQAADWVAGLVGRFGAYWYASEQYPENECHQKYFETRLKQVEKRSSIRAAERDLPLFRRIAANNRTMPQT